jgi:4-methyl-5(b-hydroxyethyl)-thiazole monophosphate biosynthesis
MSVEPPRVLVPLAEGAEELETVTIVDVLRRAGAEVVLAGLAPGPVTCSRGVVLVPDATLDDLDPAGFDAVVLPGGAGGAQRLRDDPRVLALLRGAWETERVVAAVCAGPIALHAAGILEGRACTSHPSVRDALVGAHYREERVVRDGRLLTSRGPGTALEFALALVAELCGTDRAAAVAAPMVLHPALRTA